jgi:hypothetical protein
VRSRFDHKFMIPRSYMKSCRMACKKGTGGGGVVVGWSAGRPVVARTKFNLPKDQWTCVDVSPLYCTHVTRDEGSAKHFEQAVRSKLRNPPSRNVTDNGCDCLLARR